MAAVIGVVLSLASGWIAFHWLKSAAGPSDGNSGHPDHRHLSGVTRWPLRFIPVTYGIRRLDVLNLSSQEWLR
jgi:hypothetical protein